MTCEMEATRQPEQYTQALPFEHKSASTQNVTKLGAGFGKRLPAISKIHV